ncbi:hypothetical protein BDA96_10G163100 [Sorghum bicolor]|uniref:Uncharacterized protein n=1 Tax=Sorghum bicolor TaxID=4558 RepID=A0A921U0F3_SORBI|nr:hypothetical protein BDA96_10G163100 [Sorghum bicolor]
MAEAKAHQPNLPHARRQEQADRPGRYGGSVPAAACRCSLTGRRRPHPSAARGTAHTLARKETKAKDARRACRLASAGHRTRRRPGRHTRRREDGSRLSPAQKILVVVAGSAVSLRARDVGDDVLGRAGRRGIRSGSGARDRERRPPAPARRRARVVVDLSAAARGRPCAPRPLPCPAPPGSRGPRHALVGVHPFPLSPAPARKRTSQAGFSPAHSRARGLTSTSTSFCFVFPSFSGSHRMPLGPQAGRPITRPVASSGPAAREPAPQRPQLIRLPRGLAATAAVLLPPLQFSPSSELSVVAAGDRRPASSSGIESRRVER